MTDSDHLGHAAQSARSGGQRVAPPAGAHNAAGVSPGLSWLVPIFWFRNLRALLYIVLAMAVMAAVAIWVDWRALLVAPVACWFAHRWWKNHSRQDQVCLIEIRAEGQTFRQPHVPFEFRVPDSALRIFFGPRKLYDRALKWGVYQPILETPANVVFCDYFDEIRNVIIYNEDPEWTNLALIAQLNQTTAKNIKKRGTRIQWIQDQKKRAVAEFKAGKMPRETLDSILKDLDEEVDVIRESPLSKRSFAHYYQNKIPELKRQVIQLVKGIEEYAHAIGAELAMQFYGQPMSPEIEQTIALRKTKWQKIKMNIFDDFTLMPEYEEANEREFSDQELHELAQRAAGASHRATNLATAPESNPVV